VLTHGSPASSPSPVEYSLACDGGAAVASFKDVGPPVHDHLGRQMPPSSSESGRGLVLARMLLDELGYRREDGFNRWRLVKRL
jgi:anti-sigma regulatory factor (Ser/Thr protein kinase)